MEGKKQKYEDTKAQNSSSTLLKDLSIHSAKAVGEGEQNQLLFRELQILFDEH